MENQHAGLVLVSAVVGILAVIALVGSLVTYGRGNFARAKPWAYAAFFGCTLMVAMRVLESVWLNKPSGFIFAALWAFMAFMSYLRIQVCRDELAKQVDRTGGKG